MRITIEIRRPRRRTAALLLALVLLAAPAVVLASHQFTDVPTGHPFHGQIAAIADAGITAGFNDGTYRPSDPVTRQAMAAFMERGFGHHAMAYGGDALTLSLNPTTGQPSTPAVPIRSIDIVVPGASNAFGPQQIVHLRGHVVLDGVMYSNAYGCPCTFEAYIRDETTDTIFMPQHQTFESSTTFSTYYSFDVDAFFLAEPGPRTYTLEAGLFYRANPGPPGTFGFADQTSLTAMTFPFSMGGDVE